MSDEIKKIVSAENLVKETLILIFLVGTLYTWPVVPLEVRPVTSSQMPLNNQI